MKRAARSGFLPLLVMTPGLLFFTGSAVAGGAWIRPAGSIYARTALVLLSSRSFYTPNGNRVETADFNTSSLDLYAEYGLGRRFDAVLRFPIHKRFAFETSETSAGIGDLGILLRREIRAGTTPVALGLGVDFPTGDSDGSTPLKGENGANGGTVRLPTGDGETNVRAAVYLSRSLHPAPAYLTAEAGYNLRSKGLADEYFYALQVGLNPLRPLRINAFLNGVGPVTEPSPGRADVSNGFGEGVQYMGVGGGLALQITRALAVSIDVFGSTGRIANIYGGRNTVLGLSIEY